MRGSTAIRRLHCSQPSRSPAKILFSPQPLPLPRTGPVWAVLGRRLQQKPAVTCGQRGLAVQGGPRLRRRTVTLLVLIALVPLGRNGDADAALALVPESNKQSRAAALVMADEESDAELDRCVARNWWDLENNGGLLRAAVGRRELSVPACPGRSFWPCSAECHAAEQGSVRGTAPRDVRHYPEQSLCPVQPLRTFHPAEARFLELWVCLPISGADLPYSVTLPTCKEISGISFVSLRLLVPSALD